MTGSMNESSLPLRHGVDRLVVSGHRVFGWGWIARPGGGVRSVSVRIRGDGWERRVAAGYGLARPDVEETLPGYQGAASSGFMVTGFIPDGSAREFVLEAELDDGSHVAFDVGHVAENVHVPGKKTRVLAWLARSVWRRLKRGDIRGIIRRAQSQSYGAQTVDDLNIVEQLLPALANSAGVCLMFDHNMGGGANQYRRGMIAQRLAAGQTVLLCTYNLPTLDYRLHLHEPGKEPGVFRASTFLVLDSLIGEAPVRELFVNSPVSFDEPLVLAEWLAKVRTQRGDIRLLVSAHDYFSVCPSFVLLDADGRYCGIPEISQCVSCLKRHEASYVSLSPPTEITAWRASWERCLRAADEVRCYSSSTREHLLRAYPGLDPARLTLVPHVIDFVPTRQPRIDHRAPLVIGVIGEISVQKGALIVQGIVDRLDRENLDARLVVLGSLDVAHKSERLRVTGRYQRSELPELVETHGVNMFFFPSIWPETFSYVVAEMALLGLPIVAFDVGAPAERLRRHAHARLVPEIDADAALDTLIAFHRQLALEQAPAA
jgi:glycosyltransferase involved in cell wall biosynthesis